MWFADCLNRVFDCLLEYLTVLLEHMDLEWQAQQTFGQAYTLPGPPLATPLAVSCNKK